MPRKRSAAEAAALIAAHRSAPRKRRGRPEALIQASIVAALKRAGFAVYSTSQGYRAAPGGTRMTPGLPDLYAVNPRSGHALWVECKAPGGRLRDAQARFRQLHVDARYGMGPCAADEVPPPVFVWQSLDEAHNWLQRQGLMVQRDDGAWRFPYGRLD